MIPKNSLASALAIAIAMSGPAIAQQFAPEEGEAPAIGAFPRVADEQAEPDAERDAEPDADAPDAPEETEAAPAPDAEALAPEAQVPIPEVYEIVRDTFQDWEVRCAPDGDDCFIYQLALDGDDNPVAEFSLVRLPEGSEAVAGATVVTPLGTLLPAGLVLQIDDGEARQYPFTFCSQVGCFAQLALTQTTVAAMQRGRVAQLTIASIAAPNDPVELELSLLGFTAAYNSITPGN